MVSEMKKLETLEEQRRFLQAVGNVLANKDIGLIKDTVSIEYGHDDIDEEIFNFKFGFSSHYETRLGQKICEECKKLGL